MLWAKVTNLLLGANALIFIYKLILLFYCFSGKEIRLEVGRRKCKFLSARSST
jgi:hypothetical protein